MTLSANLTGRWNPVWAGWAGCLAVIGFFNRTFSAGVDHLAFQLVRVQNLGAAYQAVSDSYRAFHIYRYTNGCIMIGWVLLAIGAYRAGVCRRTGARSRCTLPAAHPLITATPGPPED